MQQLLQLDYRIFYFINTDCANVVLDILCPILRDRMTWIPVYLLLFIFIFYKYKLYGIKMIVGIVLCFALADSISFQLLKPLFHRLRPCHNDLLNARLLLHHCGGKWSFPSSHASDHAAISMGIILFGIFKNKIMKFIVLLWALAVGFSQIYVGVHYPLDIAAGIFLGIACAYLSFYLMNKFGKKILGLLH